MYPNTFMFLLRIKDYRNTGLVHWKGQRQLKKRRVRGGRTYRAKTDKLNKWRKRRKTLEEKERWMLGGRVRWRRILRARKGKNMNCDKENILRIHTGVMVKMQHSCRLLDLGICLAASRAYVRWNLWRTSVPWLNIVYTTS